MDKKELVSIKMEKPIEYVNEDGVKIELFPVVLTLKEDNFTYTFEGKVVMTNSIDSNDYGLKRKPYHFNFTEE